MTNVITIAKGSSRAKKITLKDHLGPAGWEKDAKIMAYANYIKDLGELSEAELFTKIVKDDRDNFVEAAKLSLGEIDVEKFTMIDIFTAFMESMAYRMNQFNNEEFKEAEKK